MRIRRAFGRRAPEIAIGCLHRHAAELYIPGLWRAYVVAYAPLGGHRHRSLSNAHVVII